VKKYSDKTNPEINALVFEKLTGKKPFLKNGEYFYAVGCVHARIPDYCGSNDDCMPLAWDNGFSIINDGDVCRVECYIEYTEEHGAFYASAISKNPLRAICECYLMKGDL
jgi:hypothetical protein